MSFRLRNVLIFLHLLSISLLKLAAQEFSYTNLSIPDGLVQTQIQSLLQDSRGYIWVGTKGGVSRYDGQNFHNFTMEDGLLNTTTLGLSEDHEGNIWAINRQGICIIHPDNRIEAIDNPYPDTHIDLVFFSQKVAYVIIFSGKNLSYTLYKLKNKQFKYVLTLHQGVKKLVLPLLNDPVIFDYQKSSARLYYCKLGEGLRYIQNETIHKVEIGDINLLTIRSCRDGKMYGADSSRLYRIEENSLTPIANLKNFNLMHNRVFEVTQSGDILYNDAGYNLHLIRNNIDYTDRKAFTTFSHILVDNEQNIWLGNDASGLYRINNTAFVNFLPEKEGMLHYVFGIVEDPEKNLWFGSLSEGLTRYDGKRFTKMTQTKNLTNNEAFYPGNLLTRDGRLLIAHTNSLMEWTGKAFRWFYPDSNYHSIFQTVEDTKHQRIVSACNQCFKYLDKEGNYKIFYIKPGNKRNTSIVSISIDPRGRYWLGSFGGMSIWDEGKVTPLPTKEYPYNGGATCQYWDENERLWIGHETGLFLLEKGKVSRLGKNEMPHWVNAISRMDQDHLLIGAINGLGILDLKHFNETGEAKIELYNQENGYEGVEVNQNGIFKDSKGYFWIINADRVVRLEPGALRKNTTPPPVVIRKIWGFKEDMSQYVLLDQWKHDTSVTYSWHETKLRFEFNALSFTARPRIRYQYQLVGFDKAWSAPVAENTATYTNLSPGHYVFKVRAFNNSGVESPEEALIHIYIKPAFWQTWWFYTIVILGFLTGIVSLTLYFNNRRRNHKHQELRKEKELIDLQLKTIRNQIDPHFTFNAMNSIGAVIYKEDKLKAYSFFSRFSGLIRAVLESSDKTERSLQDEIEFVTNYLELEKLRFKEKFDYTIDVDSNVDTGIQVPKLIIQAYAENALKHGLMHREIGGLLEIRVDSPWSIVHSTQSTVHSQQSTVDYITICITDNGVGRVFTREYNRNNPASTGKGLHIMDDYYALFEKLYNIRITADIEDLYTETGEPSGTRVRVRVPVRK